jgi:hypothetical protein
VRHELRIGSTIRPTRIIMHGITTKVFITSDGNSKLIAIIESSRGETPMSKRNIGPGGTIIPTTSGKNHVAS